MKATVTGYPPKMGKRVDLVFNIGVHCTYMGDELDWVPAPDGEEGGLGGLVDVPQHVLQAGHRRVGLPDVLREDGDDGDVGVQGHRREPSPLPPRYLVLLKYKVLHKNSNFSYQSQSFFPTILLLRKILSITVFT